VTSSVTTPAQRSGVRSPSEPLTTASHGPRIHLLRAFMFPRERSGGAQGAQRNNRRIVAAGTRPSYRRVILCRWGSTNSADGHRPCARLGSTAVSNRSNRLQLTSTSANDWGPSQLHPDPLRTTHGCRSKTLRRLAELQVVESISN